MMDIKERGMTLERFQIVTIDGGRLSIPVAEWGYVYFDEYHRDVIRYKYFVKGSHREQLMQFMHAPENPDERLAFNKNEKATLFFESEIEKNCFEEYIDNNKLNLKKCVDSSNAFDYIKTECETKTKEYKKSIRTGIVLKEILEQFRMINKTSYEKC